MCRLRLPISVFSAPRAAADEADGAGAAGAAAAGARGAEGADGVIGALVCAQTGATIASAAAIATPFKRCFMPFILCGSSGWDKYAERLAQPEGGSSGPRARNNAHGVSFPRTRNLRCHVSDLAGGGII